jgi:hypothetical protein
VSLDIFLAPTTRTCAFTGELEGCFGRWLIIIDVDTAEPHAVFAEVGEMAPPRGPERGHLIGRQVLVTIGVGL